MAKQPKRPSPAAQPTAAPPAMPGMPGMPGMPPSMGMAGPMAQMMQMMQMMMGQMTGMTGMPGMVDPSAQPFAETQPVVEEDQELEADIVRPSTLQTLTKTQEALPTGSVLDYLVLSPDKSQALGGLPKGCTIAFAGPPGQGKSRTAMSAIARLAAAGHKVAFVVAEEGFVDPAGSGRDDLASRLAKIAMATLGLDEAGFRERIAPQLWVLQAQYHKGHTWTEFVNRYRYLVEKAQIDFVVIDSLNTLDPSRNRTAENLANLKTYNHEQGITCLTIGQIRDTGQPVGGEALMHTADAVYLLEELSLGSKEMAEFWGGQYRERLLVIRAVKCISAPIFPHPVRVQQAEPAGALAVHPKHPAQFALPPLPPPSADGGGAVKGKGKQ